MWQNRNFVYMTAYFIITSYMFIDILNVIPSTGIYEFFNYLSANIVDFVLSSCMLVTNTF